MELKGSWTKTTSGGNLEKITWRLNPQYVLSSTDEKVSLSLVSTEHDAKFAIGIYVLQVPRGIDVPIFQEKIGDSNLVIAKSEFRKDNPTAILDVSLKKGHTYVVIPCWNSTIKQCDFELRCSSGKLDPVSTHIYKSLAISGEWSDENFGGNLKSKTFSKNASFLIKVAKKTRATIILKCLDSSSKMAFYVFKGESSQLDTYKNEQPILECPISTNEVQASHDFSAGDYVFVPYAETEEDSAEWKALILSREVITLTHSENAEVTPKQRKKVVRAGTSKGKGEISQRLSRKESPHSSASSKMPRSSTLGKKSSHGRMKGSLALCHPVPSGGSGDGSTEGRPNSLEEGGLEQLNSLEARLNTERQKSETERVHFEETRSKLEETVTRLTMENQKLIHDLNELKKRKNEREEELFKQIEELNKELEKYHTIEQEAEDSMDWTLPIVTTTKIGTKIDIPGEWKGKSAGGCLNHLSWIHNPQIFMKADKNTNIKITLYQPKGAANSINFYVFKTYYSQYKKILLPYKDEDIVCEAYFSDKKPSKVTAGTTLAQSSTPYVLVPATFLPHTESRWIFSLESEHPIEAQLAGEAEEWQNYEDSWSGTTAGGCSNFPTFVNNPQFLFYTASHIKVTFFLFQGEIPHQVFDTIGLYILKSVEDTQKIIEYLPSLEVARVNFTNPNQVSLIYDFTPGYYTIIPSTFNPGQEARFELYLLSSQNLPPQALKPLVPRSWLSIKGAWKGESAGGSLNNKATWKNNPQFALKVLKDHELIIRLTQESEEKKFGIGFYIFLGDGKRIQTITTQNVSHKGEYRPDKTVKEKVKFTSRGSPQSSSCYVIVPSTFNPNEECSFSIDITSGDPAFINDVSIEVQN